MGDPPAGDRLDASRVARLVLALLLLAPAGVAAQPADREREPLVLLLSGGGARGAAHVGVLKVLEEEHVRVDAIVGTSMGALIGGLYAAGLSAAEIEQTMLEADWDGLFRDTPERALESYRRKQDQREFLVHGRLRVDGLKPELPLGAIRGQRVVDLLRGKTAPVAAIEEFSRLPIPFRAVASDLETGEAVVIDRGDLALAMRASMAVPGVFTPIEIGGRHLVDGGIAENLAVEVARRSGPARIVAVDISSPPLPFDELGSAAAVLNQAITLLMARENERQLAQLGEGDLLIRPELGTFSSAAFSRAADAIRIGEDAARAAVVDLRRLAVSEAEYSAWRERIGTPPPPGPGRLAGAVVHAPDDAEGRATRRRLERLVGRPYDPEALRKEVERARATGLYESVDLVVASEGTSDVVADLTLVPRVGGEDALVLGLRLFDDFEGGTDFDLGARWIGRHLTSQDLELRADLRLGERQAAVLDLYRPIGATHTFFLGVAGGFREEPFGLYLGESFFVRLRRRDLFARVDLGAALGRWGELRLGVEQDWSRLRRSSDEGLDVGSLRFDESLARGLFGVDTLDDASFPRRGGLVRAEVARILSSGLEEEGLSFGSLLAQQAWTMGESRMLASFEGADTFSGTPRFPRAVAGGLFRLSGFAEGELRGSRLAIGSLRIARPFAGEAARNPLFFGASAELGSVLPSGLAVSWERTILNGSLYLSVDSLLGPVYLYVGFAEGGRRSWGFSLGRQIF